MHDPKHRTVGHTGLARLCLVHQYYRTRSPHFYKWWEHVTADLFEHYKTMTTEYLPGDESSKNEWNKKVNAIIDKHSLEDGSGKKVLDFLFASDCHGIMFYDTCKTILDMIDSELVSQIMMQDNGNYASLKDFHDLLSDVCKNHGKVVWS